MASDQPATDAPEYVCDGWDWRSGEPRYCALRLGHRGSCSGDPCEHPVYMDGRCYDCGAPHPADCSCASTCRGCGGTPASCLGSGIKCCPECTHTAKDFE